MKKIFIITLSLGLLVGCQGKDSSSIVSTSSIPFTSSIAESTTSSSYDSSIVDSSSIDSSSSTPIDKGDFIANLPNSQRLMLRCSNKTSTSYATFEARYENDGISITSYFYDDDLYARNIYDIGFDDNIEFNFSLVSDNTAWEKGKTFHFLMNGAGKIYFQVANSSNSFGTNFDRSLHVVVGENLIYSYERLHVNESPFDGFKCEVFFAYDLLNTTKSEAEGAIAICPAMRNTHIYSVDTAWASYQSKGCSWDNVSSFITIETDGNFAKH